MSLPKLEYGINPGNFRGVIGELPDGSIGKVFDDKGTAMWYSDLNLRIITETTGDGKKEFTLSGTGAGDKLEATFIITASDAMSEKEFGKACLNAFGAKNRVGGLTFETVQKMTMQTKTDVRCLKRVTAPTWDNGIPLIPGLNLDPDVEFKLGQYTPAFVCDGDIEKASQCVRHMLEFTAYSPILTVALLASPMVARWFKNDRFGISIFGETQSFKTATFTAFMCMYGVGYSEKSALLKAGKISATSNAGPAAFAGAGFLPILYDNVKAVNPKDSEAYIGLMQSVIEGREKARLNKDGSEKTAREFTCLPAVTGEIKPAEAATSGRIPNLIWCKPTKDELEHLTYIQQHVEDMPVIGYQWLLHLSKIKDIDMDRFRELRKAKFAELTDRHCVDAGRTSTVYALFKLTWDLLCDSTFGDVFKEFNEKFDESLDATILQQSASVGEETEVARFMDGLKELMATQPAKFPKNEWFRKGSEFSDNIQAGGFIGIQCDNGVFLMPGLTLKALKDMGVFQQIPNQDSMGQALNSKGYLKIQQGYQYAKKINGIKKWGWMIKSGIFTDKFYQDIPANL